MLHALRLATAALVARYTLAPVGACICLFETSAKPAKQVSKSILFDTFACSDAHLPPAFHRKPEPLR